MKQNKLKLLRIAADKREIKDFPKLPSATSVIRETLYTISSLISEQCIGVKEWRIKYEEIIENSFQSIK